jgi:hypothetical protein
VGARVGMTEGETLGLFAVGGYVYPCSVGALVGLVGESVGISVVGGIDGMSDGI